MKTIALLAHKGGVGKTTLATNLAVASSLAGYRTALIDLDPQRSASFWWRIRSGAGEVLAFAESEPKALHDQCAQFDAEGVDFVFVDTTPGLDREIASTLQSFDLLLIPSQPSPIDLKAVSTTMALADNANRAAAIVLNQCPPVGKATRQAIDLVLNELRFPTVPHVLVRRLIYQRAFGEGRSVLELEPEGKAAAEVLAVFDWLLSQTNKKGEPNE